MHLYKTLRDVPFRPLRRNNRKRLGNGKRRNRKGQIRTYEQQAERIPVPFPVHVVPCYPGVLADPGVVLDPRSHAWRVPIHVEFHRFQYFPRPRLETAHFHRRGMCRSARCSDAPIPTPQLENRNDSDRQGVRARE
jgi:hypothetical protein